MYQGHTKINLVSDPFLSVFPLHHEVDSPFLSTILQHDVQPHLRNQLTMNYNTSETLRQNKAYKLFML
jgi:hypothetical protein